MNFRVLFTSIVLYQSYLRLVKGDGDGDNGDENFQSTEQRNRYPGRYPPPSFPSWQPPQKTYPTYEADDDAPRPSDGFLRPSPRPSRFPAVPSGHVRARPSLLGNVPMYHEGVTPDDDDDEIPRAPGFVAPQIPRAQSVPVGAVLPPKRGDFPLPHGNHEQSFPKQRSRVGQNSEEFDLGQLSVPQHGDDDDNDDHLQKGLNSDEQNKGLGFIDDRNSGDSSGEKRAYPPVNSGEKSEEREIGESPEPNEPEKASIVTGDSSGEGRRKGNSLGITISGTKNIGSNGGIHDSNHNNGHSKETLSGENVGNENDEDGASRRPGAMPAYGKIKGSDGHSDSSETGYIAGEADEPHVETGRKSPEDVAKGGVSGGSDEASARLYTGTQKSDEEVGKSGRKTTRLRDNLGSTHSNSNMGQESGSIEDRYSDGGDGKARFNGNKDESDSNGEEAQSPPLIYNDDDKAEYEDDDDADAAVEDGGEGRRDDDHDVDTSENGKGDVSIGHASDTDSQARDNGDGFSDPNGRGESSERDNSYASNGKQPANKNPIRNVEETSISKETDDSSEHFSPGHRMGKSDDSRDSGGDDSDGEKGDDDEDNNGDSDADDYGGDTGRESCTVKAVGRCLGRLANFHSRTLPTHLFSTVDDFCSAVETMNRCFRSMRNNCPADVLYRVNVLKQSTNYICNEKREDFGEVYNCLLKATDRYSRCFESYTAAEGSPVQRKCRPVENFEECVAQVTTAECGQMAGELVRNYYQQSSLNPLVDTDPDMVCPAIESLKQEDGTPDRQKTVLAVALTLTGCVTLAAGVVISAIVGAYKRTQMAHYILQEA